MKQKPTCPGSSQELNREEDLEEIQPSPIYTLKIQLGDSEALMALTSYHYNNRFISLILSLLTCVPLCSTA